MHYVRWTELWLDTTASSCFRDFSKDEKILWSRLEWNEFGWEGRTSFILGEMDRELKLSDRQLRGMLDGWTINWWLESRKIKQDSLNSWDI